MKTSVFNWHTWAIGSLVFLNVMNIFSELSNQNAWYMIFIISKIVGFSSAYLLYRLVGYWEKKGVLTEINLN